MKNPDDNNNNMAAVLFGVWAKEGKNQVFGNVCVQCLSSGFHSWKT